MYQFVVVAAIFFFLAAGLSAQQRERTTIPEKYKWDLTQIYRSNEAWRAAKDHLEKEIPTVRTFKHYLLAIGPIRRLSRICEGLLIHSQGPC